VLLHTAIDTRNIKLANICHASQYLKCHKSNIGVNKSNDPKEIEVLERSRVSDFSVTEDNSHCIFSGKRLTIKALASKHFIAIHEGFDENTVESEGESETNEGNCVVNPQLRV